jgi:hypothetical protein
MTCRSGFWRQFAAQAAGRLRRRSRSTLPGATPAGRCRAQAGSLTTPRSDWVASSRHDRWAEQPRPTRRCGLGVWCHRSRRLRRCRRDPPDAHRADYDRGRRAQRAGRACLPRDLPLRSCCTVRVSRFQWSSLSVRAVYRSITAQRGDRKCPRAIGLTLLGVRRGRSREASSALE